MPKYVTLVLEEDEAKVVTEALDLLEESGTLDDDEVETLARVKAKLDKSE